MSDEDDAIKPKFDISMYSNVNTIVELQGTGVICTTHSPYMIDLSKKPNQILNSLNEACKLMFKNAIKLFNLKVECSE